MMDPKNRQTSGQPAQHQGKQPGKETAMDPLPLREEFDYQGSGKLDGKVALVTGGDSGIGGAVSIAFAKEGADVAIVYRDEHEDAELTKNRVQKEGVRCIIMAGDVGDRSFCQEAIEDTVKQWGKLDILVNNAAEQHPKQGIEDISTEQLEQTFRSNIFSMFHMTKAALNHMGQNGSIINTASITAYEGNEQLIDYSSTKGAVVSFTRSIAKSLVNKGIRVNGVAPGPIWTPLIPSTFSAEKVKHFGTNTPMSRPGQPAELAPSYVLLASDDSSYMTGQMLHINGGQFVTN